MANTTIQLKKSPTPGAIPSDLANGELSLNFADGKIFYKDTSNTIVEFPGINAYNQANLARIKANSSAQLSFSTVIANGNVVVAASNSDILTIIAGQNIKISTNSANNGIVLSADSKTTVPIQNTAPVSPTVGDIWWNNELGTLFIYYDNGGSPTWVDSANAAIGVAFRQVVANGNTINASANIVSLRLVAGENITINSNTQNGMVVIGSSGGGASVSVQNTAPSTPTNGNLWFNTDLGRLLIYYNDGTSSQWVDATLAGTANGIVITGDYTPAFEQANAGLSLANAAFNAANLSVGLFFAPQANIALANSTAVQGWFGANAVLEANTLYFFEGMLATSKTVGGTSRTTTIGFRGTAATVDLILRVDAKAGDTSATGGLGTAIVFSETNINPSVTAKAASTATTEQALFYISGSFRTSNTGTWEPTIQYSAAPGNPQVRPGSFVRLYPVQTTANSIGNWI